MKILLKSLAALLLILLLAIAAFVLLVDANRFKPHIESLAKDRGIALDIEGDLGWNLWPSLGVAVNQVSLAALETPASPIAKLDQASLILALMPLFSGKFEVDHVLLEGADISLAVDSAGKGNWEAFSKPAAPAAGNAQLPPGQSMLAGEAEAGDTELQLDIEQFSLSSSKISYVDAQTGQQIELRDINLDMSDVNTRKEPFAMSLSFVMERIQQGADKLLVEAALKNKLSLDAGLENLAVSDGQLQLDISGAASTAVKADYALTLSNLQQDMSYKGKLALAETNLRKLLAALGTELDTAEKSALEKFSLSASVAGDGNKIAFDDLRLILDETTMTGRVAITDFATSAISATLEGDQINVDHYLPPPVETPEQEPAAAAEGTPLPLESLRALNVDASLAFKKIILKKMTMQDVALKLRAKNGVIEPVLSANAYSGAIKATAQLNARGNRGEAIYDANINGLELAPLLSDMEMDSKFGLQGAVQAQARGKTQGASFNQLLAALQSDASFSGAQVRVSPINLEQQFCKLVNLVNKADDPAQDWEKYTELEQLSGSITLRDQVVNIDTFKAGVEKLQLGSHGKINLAADTYDIFLPLKLIKNTNDTVTSEQVAVATSSQGCSIGSQYWLERGLELLRCKGSFAEINPLSDCRPDKTMLAELTKDYAAYKIKEKHGAKIEEKKDELKQKVEDKKQQLFDKLQQRLNKGASSAAASAETAPEAEPADGQQAQ